MNPDEMIKTISALIRDALVAEYERGRQDKSNEIMAVIQGGSRVAIDVALPHRAVVEAKPPTQRNRIIADDDRQRAPRGLVPKFVTDTLRRHPGITPKEISELAQTGFEKMIKPASIRSQLNAGKNDGIYISNDGKWSLYIEAEGQSLTGKPSASNLNKGGDEMPPP